MATTTQEGVKRDGAEFLLEEYRSHEAAIFESERTGETRVNFFFTVTAALIAALLFDARGLMDEQRSGPRLGACAVLLALLVFGRLTLARVVHRNLTTDREIESATRIRAYFLQADPSIARYISWPTTARKRRDRLSLGRLVTRGGLTETVMLWNALIASVLFGLFGVTGAWWVNARRAHQPLEWLPGALATATAVIGLLAAWWVQQSWVNERYETGERERAEAQGIHEARR